MGLRDERADEPPAGRAMFEQMVRAHRQQLFAHVRLLYPQADADLVVNDTFAIAWQRLSSAPPDAIGPWLRGIARNVVLNSSRGQRRWRALTDKLAVIETPPVDPPDSDARMQLSIVVSALSTLGDQDREILLMLALEDHSVDGIATIYGINGNAAKARISRARKRLREAVASVDPAPPPDGLSTDEGNAP